ncbi:MAG: glycosyltransferase family 2 protein [Candidatus Aenigmatarchaeota archaeon]
MNILVTIPAYNEEQTLGKVISDIKAVMGRMKHKFRIMVVNDGSKDRTAEIAAEHGAIVFSHPHNYGLAETFRTEMERAKELKPDIIVHTDADGQYRSEDIPRLIEPIIQKKADLVLGSRFLGKIEHMPFMKKLGNKAFSRVISKITKIKITITIREYGKNLDIISTHTYTQEMIIRAVKEKFRVIEVPVYARRTRKSRLMKSHPIIQPFEYAVKAWINMFRTYRDYQPLKFFGSIGTLLMAVGGVVGLYIIYRLFVDGLIILDKIIPTMLLSLIFLITGLQIILFGFLADKTVQ